MRVLIAIGLLGLFATLAAATDQPQVIEGKMIHLRSGEQREWSSFPESGPGFWEAKLSLAANERPCVLKLRQQDVKQAWRVLLNGKPLGDLLLDERDAWQAFALDRGVITGKGDLLRIEPKGKHASPDDVRVGEIELIHGEFAAWASSQTAEIEVVDVDGKPLPCCLTVVDERGSLVPLGMKSNDHLAVRAGVVYTSTGRAALELPPGTFTVYATRGFEYSLAQARLSRDKLQHRLTLRREVPTPGYVASDTHIHTLTHSGHGDCTIDERMITLAGEGIELPIATDHSAHVDYESHAKRLNLRQYFTPVMGNEVTTKVGHFNVFPVAAGARAPNAGLGDWKSIFDEIFATPGVKVCILNHARDLHSGVRPFGPVLFNAAVGERLDDAPLRLNAMEVINSGATQTEPLQLLHDWMALLNRGYQVTPVGSSDSHDVSRFIVGQGRTYIRCNDRDPSRIDVGQAVENFLAGRVLVSYGLLAELKVNGEYTSGDFATKLGDEISAEITVSAPHWSTADKVQLYANGQLVREEKIPPTDKGGMKWRGTWKLPRPGHDVHLVAIAIGPGISEPYWPTAKPYQPTSPNLDLHTLGCSGAVWIDGDGDGHKSSARYYAEELWNSCDKEIGKAIENLAAYDAAVVAHTLHLYRTAGGDLDAKELKAAIEKGPEQVRKGFRDYYAAWRECELARAAK